MDDAPPGRSMRFDYDAVSEHYDRHRSWTGVLPRRILQWAGTGPSDAVLEIGCGTGNFTLHMERISRSRIVALDLSFGMLAKAAGKLSRTSLVQADAIRSPFPDGSFALVAGAFVLHHIGDRDALFREIRRLVGAPNRPGRAAFVTTGHAEIRSHPLAEFFPSFAAVDLARFPDIPEVEVGLRRSGFEDVRVEPVEVRRSASERHYLEKVRGRFISTLSLIPRPEFEEGLARLEAAVASGRRLDLTWRGSLLLASVSPSRRTACVSNRPPSALSS